MSASEPKVVGDIMTYPVVTLLPEQNLTGVSDALRYFEFRHVPVVDDGKLVGVVSRTDLLRMAASDFEGLQATRTESLASQKFVTELMTTDVRTVRADTPLLEAARLLREHQIGCLPVVDDAQMLVGIVTTTDFLTLSIHFLERS